MNRIVAFLIFFSIFLGIYFGMHYYVFSRTAGLLGIKKGALFYAVLIILALLFPVMSFVERYVDGPLTRIVYSASAAWLGTLFIALCTLAVYEIFHLLWKIKPHYAGIGIIVIVVALAIYAIINAQFIGVAKLQLKIPNLQKNLTMVQLSDIHVGTINNKAYLKRIVDKVNQLKPDVVLITGDLVDGTGPLNQEDYQPLSTLRAAAFFTTGNHEQYEGLDKVIPLIQSTGVRVLRNQMVNYKGIQIIGIDNPGDGFGKGNPVLSKIRFNKSKPSILMYHPPSGLEDASRAGVNLQLSGHTHDGQIMPFNLITRLAFPRVNGLYEYNGTFLYVTAGTGTWGPPMRLGSRSEITVIKLVPSK